MSRRLVSNIDVQEQFALYRLKKEDEKKYTSRLSFSTRMANFIKNILNNITTLILPERDDDKETNDSDQNSIPVNGENCSDLNSMDIGVKSYSKIDWAVLILKIILWLILWKIFILLEFGAVFFVCSCFLVIWFSLSRSKRKGPSAYSVFNPDCEEILGTYSAEKLEKELLFR